jgi:dihydroxyacid dehydratase/phosphogluconate dehydratase
VLHGVGPAGGPLALVADGDVIVLDVEGGRIDIDAEVESAELAARVAATAPPVPTSDYAALDLRHIAQSPQGQDFDFLAATPHPNEGEQV